MSQKILRAAVILSALFVAACSTPNPTTSTTSLSNADARIQLVHDARQAMNSLYASTPHAKELANQSVGVLIFPGILKAGLLVGGSGGNGVLFSNDGNVLGYYKVRALSYGLQAGAQDFSEAMFLMTPGAKQYLESSDGWSVGLGPSVVLADKGMAKDFSTTTARSDVYAFVFGETGLMAGLGVQGQKITKLKE